MSRTVHATFSLKLQDFAPFPGASMDKDLRESSMRLRVPRVLVVDDEPLVARALSRSFGRLGIVAAVAGSAAEALARCGEANFDLVVADQNMPGVTGAELLAIIHRTRYPARFALCSGGEPPPCAVPGVAFLRKPWRDDDLRAIARLSLEAARSA